MKTRITTLILIFVAGLLFAQENNQDEIKTLFSKGAKIRGFGAFDMKISPVNDYNTLLIGGHGGIILNNNFMFGGGGYGMSTTNRFDGIDPAQVLYIYGGYGGIILGYALSPKEIVHVNFQALVGGGGFEISDTKDLRDIRDQNQLTLDHRIEYSSAFVIEPGIEAEINVTKFFRLGLGGSYRIVQGVTLDKNNITDSDLSNWVAQVSFKFGKFW